MGKFFAKNPFFFALKVNWKLGKIKKIKGTKEGNWGQGSKPWNLKVVPKKWVLNP